MISTSPADPKPRGRSSRASDFAIARTTEITICRKARRVGVPILVQIVISDGKQLSSRRERHEKEPSPRECPNLSNGSPTFFSVWSHWRPQGPEARMSAVVVSVLVFVTVAALLCRLRIIDYLECLPLAFGSRINNSQGPARHCGPPAKPVERRMAALTVERLTKNFGVVAAVSDVSFSVESGEFISLLGPSGTASRPCRQREEVTERTTHAIPSTRRQRPARVCDRFRVLRHELRLRRSG